MAASESWTTLRARLAITKRHHPDADTTELRRDLRAVRAEAYIRNLVDGFPPLTVDQRARLAVLLHAPTGGDDASAT